MINIKESPIRKLARTRKWQNLYSQAKELNFKLFENNRNLTPIQLLFLHYLQVYSNLYTDLAMEEKNISKEVIEDWIRCDAYLYFKSKNRNKDKNHNDLNTSKDTVSKDGKVIFTRG